MAATSIYCVPLQMQTVALRYTVASVFPLTVAIAFEYPLHTASTLNMLALRTEHGPLGPFLWPLALATFWVGFQAAQRVRNLCANLPKLRVNLIDCPELDILEPILFNRLRPRTGNQRDVDVTSVTIGSPKYNERAIAKDHCSFRRTESRTLNRVIGAGINRPTIVNCGPPSSAMRGFILCNNTLSHVHVIL